MNAGLQPSPENLYESHRKHAEHLKNCEEKLYNAYECAVNKHLYFEDPMDPTPVDQDILNSDLGDLKTLHREHGIAIMMYLRDLMMNKKFYDKNEGAYQQSAVELAAADGKGPLGWQW